MRVPRVGLAGSGVDARFGGRPRLVVRAGVAGEIRAREARIVDVCLSPDFSPGKLLNVIKDDR